MRLFLGSGLRPILIRFFSTRFLTIFSQRPLSVARLYTLIKTINRFPWWVFFWQKTPLATCVYYVKDPIYQISLMMLAALPVVASLKLILHQQPLLISEIAWIGHASSYPSFLLNFNQIVKTGSETQKRAPPSNKDKIPSLVLKK